MAGTRLVPSRGPRPQKTSSRFPAAIICFIWIFVSVPPTVRVSQSSTVSGVVVTCHVERFYPQDVYLTWLEDCHVLRRLEQPTPKRNKDGSYTLEISKPINTSVQRPDRVLTCKVEHEAQPPIQASIILSTASYTTSRAIGILSKFTSFLLGILGSPWFPHCITEDTRKIKSFMIIDVLSKLGVCSFLNRQNDLQPVASFRVTTQYGSSISIGRMFYQLMFKNALEKV